MSNFYNAPSNPELPSTKITVEEAQSILNERSSFNRNLKPAHVKKLAEHMVKGTFLYNGDPIRFNTNGLLIDGQHRLSALVLANKREPSITHGYFNVLSGLPDNVMDTIDTNINRSPIDRLSVRIKEKLPPSASAILCRMLMANIAHMSLDTDTLEKAWVKFKSSIIFALYGLKGRPNSFFCANIAAAHYLGYDIVCLDNMKKIFFAKDHQEVEPQYQPIVWLLDEIEGGNIMFSGGKNATKAYISCQEAIWAVLNHQQIDSLDDDKFLPINFINRFPIHTTNFQIGN